MVEIKLPREAEIKNEIKSENIELLKSYSNPFWLMPWQSVLKHMKTSEKGLKQSEVTTRLLKYGKNEIIENKSSKLAKITISQLVNPICYVLVAVALISFIFAEVQTAIIISFMTLLFFILRFMQDYTSGRALEKLKNDLTFSARTIREEIVIDIDTKELVPGDIVILSNGDRVPADIRLIDTDGLQIDESILTGELYPVEKTVNVVTKSNPIPQQMNNIAFAGSIVTKGRAVGVVIATGIKTQFAKKAFLPKEISDEYKFQKELKKIGNSLSVIGIVVFLFVLLVGWYLGHNLIASLLFAAAIAAILLSERLQPITTLFLSLAASKLSDKGVTIKRLSALEDLGNADVVCCDKTGTLTEGRLHVADYFDVEGKRDDTALLLSLQCCSATSMKHHLSGNVIDVSLMKHARSHPNLQLLSNRYSKAFEIPFDYGRKRMSVVVKTKEKPSKHILICKGAPEVILSISTNAVVRGKVIDIKVNRNKIMEKYIELSKMGYRVIAVAIKEVRRQDSYTFKSENDLTFVGFVTFLDPPRRSAKDALRLANKHGIAIKILTGDDATLTRTIANKVGFNVSPGQIVIGRELDEIIKKENFERLEKTVIFARLTPEQKARVIQVLRSRGKVVAFVGGEINDTAPLREANLGIAMQTGADVIKNESDVVMAQKSLNSLIDTILESRNAFANVMRYIRCILAVDVGEFFIVMLSSAFLNFVIMLPIQILIAKFLTDLPLIGLSKDKSNDQELRRPRELKGDLITRNGAILGAINAVFGLVVVILMISMSEGIFHSALFLELVLSGALVVLSLRTIKPIFIAKRPSIWLLATIAVVSIVGISLVFSPFASILGFETPFVDLVLFTIGIAIAYMLTTDIAKHLMYRDLWREEEINADKIIS